MFQDRHMLRLLVEGVKEAVSDALLFALPIIVISHYLKLLFPMTICRLSSQT